jgi:hypothetical protein
MESIERAGKGPVTYSPNEREAQHTLKNSGFQTSLPEAQLRIEIKTWCSTWERHIGNSSHNFSLNRKGRDDPAYKISIYSTIYFLGSTVFQFPFTMQNPAPTPLAVGRSMNLVNSPSPCTPTDFPVPPTIV